MASPPDRSRADVMRTVLDTESSNVTSIDRVRVAIERHTSLEYLPLIPAGNYQVAFDYFETCYRFGKSAKLVLHFHIVDMGPHFETPIDRWYSVDNIGKKGSRGGNFKVKGQTSIFLIEYLRCLPGATRPARLDRVPMSQWSNHIFRAKVSNVVKNHKQKQLPPELQYSRIESLLGVSE